MDAEITKEVERISFSTCPLQKLSEYITDCTKCGENGYCLRQRHAAPPKVRDGGEAVQREYAETLVKSWRAQERRTSAQEIQDVFDYLLDGAIEREDDGGFVTVTILKSKFDTLKKDYARALSEEVTR